MKKLGLLILLAWLLTGCSACKKEYVPINGIIKTDAGLDNRMEGTPVVFNSQLIYIISNRHSGQESIEFYDKDLKLRKSIHTKSDLISAIVHNNELYIFSTLDRKKIQFIKTNDLESFTEPVVVLEAPEGTNYFNTSVAFNGEAFTMAYEVCETGKTCFNVRFAQSLDLVTWTSVGKTFSPNEYAACPMIRFFDGFYYITYLRFNGKIYETHISRSKDLVNWEFGGIVLSPKDNKDQDSLNNSDMDMVEFLGEVIVQYAEGDQKPDGWANIRLAKFKGTEKELLESFFNR